MTQKVLYGALAAFLVSYSYSETVPEYGVTNNAVSGQSLTWDMQNILPVPGGLLINGVVYKYTVEKDQAAGFEVSVQNENALGDGYIFKETDDWSNLPGSTISKLVPLGNIPMEYFGQGSIDAIGDGNVSDPVVRYSYRLDPCYVPLSDPSCPGYVNALYDWLKENGLLPEDANANDPYYDELVQAALNKETDLEEDETKTEEDEIVDEEIELLNAGASISALVDPAIQNSIMVSLSMIPNFENYYDVKITGGVYEETITLQDTELPDNAAGMRNLAQDSLHKSMVRLQYDN